MGGALDCPAGREVSAQDPHPPLTLLHRQETGIMREKSKISLKFVLLKGRGKTFLFSWFKSFKHAEVEL